MIVTIREFLKLESASGILLFVAAMLALVFVNSPLASLYHGLLEVPVEIRVGNFEIAKNLLHWINDGLMVFFFFLVGLEVKREFLVGELSDKRNIILPAMAATGGMLVPGLIYVAINQGTPEHLSGWAIPTATDIAFSLGVLTLLGNRVPMALKLFLVTLAILDDMGAIIIIAMFYTDNLSPSMLGVAAACTVVLFLLNRNRVSALVPYVLVGVVMWAAVLKSGVHATLAGIVLAFFIPMQDAGNPQRSPLRELEHELHPVVAYFTLPLFAFFNSGIPLLDMSVADLLHPVPLGISAGLVLGKPLGIFLFAFVAIALGMAKLPTNSNYRQLFAIAMLCGIGFTMSLFIGSLAFENASTDHRFDERTGILLGSAISGILGYLMLRFTLPKQPQPTE